jgi:hypothetical protein
MKITIVAALAVAVLGAFALSRVASRKAAQVEPSAEAKQESPLACDLSALNPEQRKRKEELGATLRSLRKGVRELPDGVEFELPSDARAFQAAAEWASLERLCCPFFDFDLRLEREGGPLRLSLTGREGVKQFINAEIRPE